MSELDLSEVQATHVLDMPLKRLTSLFSAEFAIRTFLLADTGRALAILDGWTDDPNHVTFVTATAGSPCPKIESLD